MKKTAMVILSLNLQFPAAAWAVEEAPGMSDMYVRMFTTLAFIVGGLLVVLYLLKKFSLQRTNLFGNQKCMRVVETLYLGPKKTITLVQVGGEYVLLGQSASQMQFLSKIDAASLNVAESQEPPQPLPGQDRPRRFAQLLMEHMHISQKLQGSDGGAS